MTVRDADLALRATLSHWKNGTGPGDDPVTEDQVGWAISDLVEAMINAHQSSHHDEGR